MKKILLLAFAATVLLAGCKDDEVPPELIVSQDKFTIPASGGEGEFIITADAPWTLSEDNPGLFSKLEPKTGPVGDTKVSFAVNKSLTLGDITAVLTITMASGEPKKVTITQEGQPTIDATVKLTISPLSNVDWGWNGMTARFSTETNYQLLLSKSEADVNALLALSDKPGWIEDLGGNPAEWPRYIDFYNEDLEPTYAPFTPAPSSATYYSGGVPYGSEAQITVSPGTYYYVLAFVDSDPYMGALYFPLNAAGSVTRGTVTFGALETHVFTVANKWDGNKMWDEMTLSKEE